MCRPVPEIFSAEDGTYLIETPVPAGFGPQSKIELDFEKTGFAKLRITLMGKDFASRDGDYLVERTVDLYRSAGPAFWIATVMFWRKISRSPKRSSSLTRRIS